MNVTSFLPTLAFSFLLLLMLLYWSQAAFFGREKYKTLNDWIFLFSILSLTLLLIVRWLESGHFPLSNLYESLLFLSWSFLTLNALFRIQSKQLFSLFPISTFFSKSSRVTKYFSYKVSDKSSVLTPGDLQSRKAKPSFFSLSLSSSSGLGLGVILSPLSLLTFGFAFLSLPKEMQQATALVPALQSNWLMMHVTVMILSYAALLSGSILSIAFLILSRLEGNSSRLEEYNVQKSTFEGEDVTNLGGARHALHLPRWKNLSKLQLKGLLDLYKRARTLWWARLAKYSGAPIYRFVPPLQNRGLYVVVSQGVANLARGTTFLSPWQSHLPPEAIESGVNVKSKADTKPLGEIANKATLSRLTAQLDNWSYRSLALGFPLLTIGILSGAVWANEAWGSYWSWDPKETWALITWLVFAIYLHTRITKGWSGEKPAIVASIGFFLVWFCYLGVNLLGTGLHSYGWFSK